MVKYLTKKNGLDFTEENRNELENLKESLAKYKKLEEKQKNSNEKLEEINKINNIGNEGKNSKDENKIEEAKSEDEDA